MTESTKKLLILLAHGSNDSKWCEPFIALQGKINEQHSHTALSYLEMAKPQLETTVMDGYQAGYRHFWILPLFLAAGKHWHVDLPRLITKFEQQYQDSSFSLLPVIGEHPLLVESLITTTQAIYTQLLANPHD